MDIMGIKKYTSKDNLEDEHAYIGSQHLYLNDKLRKNTQYTNLRGIEYKKEKMKMYDRVNYVLYVIYWILYTCYGLLFIYKQEYNEITSIIILILMGAFPFFINKLSLFLIKQINNIIKEINQINIYIPSLKPEETIQEVEDKMKQATSNANKLDASYFKDAIKLDKDDSYKELRKVLQKDNYLKYLSGTRESVELYVGDENNFKSDTNNTSRKNQISFLNEFQGSSQGKNPIAEKICNEEVSTYFTRDPDGEDDVSSLLDKLNKGDDKNGNITLENVPKDSIPYVLDASNLVQKCSNYEYAKELYYDVYPDYESDKKYWEKGEFKSRSGKIKTKWYKTTLNDPIDPDNRI